MKKKVKKFDLFISVRQSESDNNEEWSLDIESTSGLTSYELATIAKEGAKKALNKIKGVKAGWDCH